MLSGCDVPEKTTKKWLIFSSADLEASEEKYLKVKEELDNTIADLSEL